MAHAQHNNLSRLPSTMLRPGEAVPATDPQMDLRVEALNALTLMHQQIDMAGAELVRARKGEALCVENCGLCCKVPVASALEVQYALSTMAVTDDVLQRAKDWLAEPMPDAVYPEATPAALGGIKNDLPADRARQAQTEAIDILGKRCPMLGEDLRCTVYAARPLQCRGVSVTVAPPEDCERPADAAEQALPGVRSIDRATGERMQYVADELMKALASADPKSASTGMFPTVVVAIADPQWFAAKAKAGEIPLAKLMMVPPHGRHPANLSQTRLEGEAQAAQQAAHPSRLVVPAASRRPVLTR